MSTTSRAGKSPSGDRTGIVAHFRPPASAHKKSRKCYGLKSTGPRTRTESHNGLPSNDLGESPDSVGIDSGTVADEITDLAALLDELPDSDRTELLASIHTLIKFYQATVNGPKKY